MARVPAGNSIYSVAYLTETGRRYLFGRDKSGNPIRFNQDGTDNFEIAKFTLHDGDRNYNTSELLESGDVPDISGTNDNGCLKTSADISRSMKIAYQGDIPGSANATLSYIATPNPLEVNVNNI